METNKPGLRALTTSRERKELRAVGTRPRPPVRLQYLRKSAQTGLRLWNVLSPVPGYKSSGDNGFPTFSLSTLKEKKLI